ncbi:MAG: hypothetical protein V1859_02035 [archaeon]
MAKKGAFIRFFLVTVLFVSSIAVVAALTPDYVISNSADWQDVYSTMLYGNLMKKTPYFLVSSKHSTLLINQIPKTENGVWVFSSKKNPYVVGYKGILESYNYPTEEFNYENINIELAKKLTGIKKYIIIDDSYGYNAVSVAPYAVLNDAYVLFTSRKNINQIYSYLKSGTVSEILIYGTVDREVKDRLAEFSPIIINKADRFENNQEIVNLYQKKHKEKFGEPKKQVILTNGEFIEQEMMSGSQPVVFIGRANVPEQVSEYIKNSDIEIGILIGNELIGSATTIRRQLGISVFVKFAQSARAPTGPISSVEDLDRFYLPRYILSLDIFRIRYNRVSNQLQVTYQNKVALSSYLKGTVTLRYGGETQTVGDVDSIFIDKNEYKTIIYDVDPINEANISADIFTIYGEAKKSLEYNLRKTINVETVSISDNAKIEIVGVYYDKKKGQIIVVVKNTGEVDAFVDVEIYDILINDELQTIGTENVAFLKVGETKRLIIPAVLDETDIENNKKVKLHAYYGEREQSLISVLSGEYDLQEAGFDLGSALSDAGSLALTYAPVLIILILLLLILGMKKKCPDCKEINNLRAKRCKKCGKEI